MKKLLLAIASFVFVAVISVNAQDVAKTETQKSVVTVAETTDNVVQEKTKIKAEELPQAVQTTLASDTYRGWEVVNAYVLKDKKQYEVELKNGAENKTFKFSEDGKVVNE
ncbi:MAG: hypothetical protein EBR30_16130 [Cytophagia bacterium]|nr:hypothetical protein [Cytophagia bacterium]NBW36511.1 hypothetical protein [Cytophagia bacterium]